MVAAVNIVAGDKQTDAFRTFPEFSRLTLADKSIYETATATYPPYVDLSFAGLMIWWNTLDGCAVSQLNNNLVISYWIPGVERYSGLSLVGQEQIDESICTIFDYQKMRGEKPRIVHVPEFVISNIEHPELFQCREERDLAEYVYDVSKFYPLNRLVSYRRLRVKRFLSEISEDRTILRQLDLSLSSHRRLLLNHHWQSKGINKLVKTAQEAVHTTIESAEPLGVECLGLFIDGVLRGYCLYQSPSDKRYVLLSHARVDYTIPRTLDYMVYALARWFAERGVLHINADSDFGMPFLRMFKVALGPSNYIRKYTLEPARGVGW